MQSVNLLALFLLGFAPSVTKSTTFTVQPNESIQAAIDVAQAGDTIILIKGETYNLSSPLV